MNPEVDAFLKRQDTQVSGDEVDYTPLPERRS